MKHLFLVLLSVLTGAQALAFKSGTITCQFEIQTTDKPTEVKLSKVFSFPLTEYYTEAFTFPFLKNRLIMAYYPGYTSPGEVTHASFLLKYDGSNSGADIPLFVGATYYTNIGKDGTELIGAFLKCHPVDLK